MGKKLIIVFIVISALELFNITFLGSNFIKIFQLAGIALMAVILVVQMVYQKEIDFQKHFNLELLLILGGVFLSMFMAQWGHDQSLSTTFIAQRFMYFYLAYWVLHSIKASIEDIEELIFWFGIGFSILYLIQYMVHPTVIFDVRIAEVRETVRIFLPGFFFLILAYFLTLNRLFESFSVGKLMAVFLFVSIVILMGTRQVIFSTMLLTIINVLFSKTIKSKILILMLMVSMVIPIIFIFQEIFISLIDLSKDQSETLEENVRLRAAVFFLTELFPNSASYITGNGADSYNSSYGYMIQMYRDTYGFYQSDIGLIGDYVRFGTLFALGALLILFRMIFSKTNTSYAYFKYFYLSILLTLFTGGGPFAQADSIVAICFTLYIMDIDKHDRSVADEEADIENEHEYEPSEAFNDNHYLNRN